MHIILCTTRSLGLICLINRDVDRIRGRLNEELPISDEQLRCYLPRGKNCLLWYKVVDKLLSALFNSPFGYCRRQIFLGLGAYKYADMTTREGDLLLVF